MAKTLPIPTVNIGIVNAVPLGQGRCFVVGSEEIAVFRQRDGRIFATQNRCPHRQGPLAEGVAGGGRVICPLHGQQFDLETGKGIAGKDCLRVFSVEESEGNLVLGLEDNRS